MGQDTGRTGRTNMLLRRIGDGTGKTIPPLFSNFALPPPALLTACTRTEPPPCSGLVSGKQAVFCLAWPSSTPTTTTAYTCHLLCGRTVKLPTSVATLAAALPIARTPHRLAFRISRLAAPMQHGCNMPRASLSTTMTYAAFRSTLCAGDDDIAPLPAWWYSEQQQTACVTGGLRF